MATTEQAGTVQENAGTAKPQENADGTREGTATEHKTTMTDEAAALLKENMQYKKKLKSLQEQIEKASTAEAEEKGKYKELYEREKASKSELQQRLIRAELVSRLPGLLKPNLIQLVDLSEIQFDDDGQLVGVEEVAKAFMESNPEFFRTGDSAAQVNVPATPKPGKPSSSGASPASFDELMKLPGDQSMQWILKNPEAYKKLCDAAKNVSSY